MKLKESIMKHEKRELSVHSLNLSSCVAYFDPYQIICRIGIPFRIFAWLEFLSEYLQGQNSFKNICHIRIPIRIFAESESLSEYLPGHIPDRILIGIFPGLAYCYQNICQIPIRKFPGSQSDNFLDLDLENVPDLNHNIYCDSLKNWKCGWQ